MFLMNYRVCPLPAMDCQDFVTSKCTLISQFTYVSMYIVHHVLHLNAAR